MTDWKFSNRRSDLGTRLHRHKALTLGRKVAGLLEAEVDRDRRGLLLGPGFHEQSGLQSMSSFQAGIETDSDRHLNV